MVGFVHSLHMQSDLNPKKKLYPFSGDGVFFVPDCSKGKTAQLHFNECVSKNWYERQLDAMLTAIGEDPKKYSVHSLRAEGATELFLAGASLAVVQNYGRWTSLSALIYFRDSCGIIAYAAARTFETDTFQCTGGNKRWGLLVPLTSWTLRVGIP